MASGLASGTTLRHLHDLFNVGTAVGLTDGQLLARYAVSNDESAFAALVARHGPMVAATCRAILHHEHDVEDAFQATFLVLARKAGSVRTGDALGGWLHRVAYRVAVQTNIASRQRRRRESDLAPWAIVHEEIDRLPERHRLPVVLCDLEGLSYEQAASRLRATVAAVRCRLSKGRERLRDRLARRGVTATALAVVIASTADASAAVGPTWASATVAAATGAASSAPAAALAQTIVRGMLFTRLKIVAAAAVTAAAGIVSAGLVVETAKPHEPGPEMNAPAASRSTAPTSNPPSPERAAEELIEVRGRVVDPDGRAVGGATVWTAHVDRKNKLAPELPSGPDGRFFLRVTPWPRGSVSRQPGARFPWVVATAPGFGPGWASAVREPGAPAELLITLVADGPPIEGRIVDLEGRPVAGARVNVENVWFERENQFSEWLKKAVDGRARSPAHGLTPLPTAITATTGSDGSFRLAGIGHDRLAELMISGPTIATSNLYAMNRDGETISTVSTHAMTPERTIYHSRRFEYAAAPTKPIEGVVRDKDTGQPIAGLTLRGMVFDEHSHVPAQGVETMTDAQGHYRLTGLPKGPAYRLFLEPADGSPYTKTTFPVPANSPALELVKFDVALKRGVIVRGRVTDKATGRPVSGYVNSYAFSDNPQVDQFPGYRSSYEAYAQIDRDGRYQVVALPGRGIIACRSDLGLYRGYVGADQIPGHDPRQGTFETFPGMCNVRNYHVLAEVNLDAKAGSAILNLEVDPGRTLAISVVDPDGKPVSGTMTTGLTDLFPTLEYVQESPTIEIHALDPSKPRRVTITHAARKLVGFIHLKGDETGSRTIRLQPWGTITGRIVDDEGQPRAGLALSNLGGIYPEPPADAGILPNGNSSPGIIIGRDGRFQVEGLVPGLKYGASAIEGFMYRGEVFKNLKVAPGEVRSLGDLKLVVPAKE
jgi:DNA-directed RNA polymerase specialized sigma24 family protein/protocatechuate 3,4-dioxygenase beta subunit